MRTPAGLLLLLLACSPLTAFAQSAPATPMRTTPGYTVRPGDVLRIRVWPDSALSGEFPVEENGDVHLPALGTVRAGDVELERLRTDLRQRYGAELRMPAVSVTPLFRVGVLGAVQRPGLYEADPSQTLFDVISLAGGFRDNAKTQSIRILRGDQVIEVNGREAMTSGASSLALALRSGDRIVVPQGRGFRWLDVFYGLQSVALIITLLAGN